MNESLSNDRRREGYCVFLTPFKCSLISYSYRSGTIDYADKLINYLLLTNNIKVSFP